MFPQLVLGLALRQAELLTLPNGKGKGGLLRKRWSFFPGEKSQSSCDAPLCFGRCRLRVSEPDFPSLLLLSEKGKGFRVRRRGNANTVSGGSVITLKPSISPRAPLPRGRQCRKTSGSTRLSNASALWSTAEELLRAILECHVRLPQTCIKQDDEKSCWQLGDSSVAED